MQLMNTYDVMPSEVTAARLGAYLDAIRIVLEDDYVKLSTVKALAQAAIGKEPKEEDANG